MRFFVALAALTGITLAMLLPSSCAPNNFASPDKFAEDDADAPVERDEDGGSSAEGGNGGGAAAASCAGPAKCRPVPSPSEWSGPFAVTFAVPGGGPLTCGSRFTRVWERSGGVFDPSAAPPATCTCECGAMTGNCPVTLSQYDDGSCIQPLGAPRVLVAGQCVPRTSGVDSVRPSVQANNASCPVNATTTASPLPGVAPIAIGCSSATPEGCPAGETCIPPLPPSTRLCVRPINDDQAPAACPAGYPSVVKLNSGYDDTRGCSPCTCAPNAPSCSFSYALFDSDNCTGLPAQTRSDTACNEPSGIDSLRLVSSTISGSCAPNGGTPTGDVKALSESSLCCSEDL